MKIPSRLAQRRLQFLALRTLGLGVCLGIASFSYQPNGIEPYQDSILYLLPIAFLICAVLIFVYAQFKRYPDQFAILHPHLDLPDSLVSGGLNSIEEPIDFWMLLPGRKRTLLLSTKKRQMQITDKGLSERQWGSLLGALPNHQRLQHTELRNSLNYLMLTYAIICLVMYLFLNKPSQFELFNLLAQGAYNMTLTSTGEWFRVLSYAWLHGSETHLLLNLFGLLLLSQAVGRSFPNRQLASVLIVSAALGGVLGNITRDFNLLIGASGAIMGVFGFLLAAQLNKDPRLPLLSRIANQKTLYLVISAEFLLSLKYSSYGGTVHLVGLASGYSVYSLTEYFSASSRGSIYSRHIQNGVIACAILLLLDWSLHIWDTTQSPEDVAKKALDTEDPFLTLVAGTGLPDLPKTTRRDIISSRQKAIDLLTGNSLLAWPIARADHWLGNHKAAAMRLRDLTAKQPSSQELRNLWLTVEREVAKRVHSHEIVSTLPAGPATAYLISAKYDQFARLKLPDSTSNIGEALTSHDAIDWYLLAVTKPLQEPKKGAYGVWPIPTHRFRTAQTAKLVAGEPR